MVPKKRPDRHVEHAFSPEAFRALFSRPITEKQIDHGPGLETLEDTTTSTTASSGMAWISIGEPPAEPEETIYSTKRKIRRRRS